MYRVEARTRSNPSRFFRRLLRDLSKYRAIYMMLLPVVAYYAIFSYWPMYGVTIAFRNYKPRMGIGGSPWVGAEHFVSFFSSLYCARVIRNTVLISIYDLLFAFPVPILFALLLNEVRCIRYKKVIQTITYLPHFITPVIVCSMILQFTREDGFVTLMVNALSGRRGAIITDPASFRSVYILSEIWQGFGWGSIIYLAAIAGINAELYEAAHIDGANKARQMIHITLPSIAPTITIMFILTCGNIMNVGWEKAFLLQSPLTYETSDIIATYVYRKGFEDMSYSYSAAVGLFNSVVNVILLVLSNAMSRKLVDNSLW